MLSIRIVVSVAWLGLLCQGSLASDTVAPPAMSMIAGHFRLATPDRSEVDSDDLAGKPYGLFFGFTHCPDVCPTTLMEVSVALGRMPNTAAGIRIYFVSVDPERDTPELLKAYMASFDPRIIALSGERIAIDEAIASFGVSAQRTDLAKGGYTYAHTASILLVDGNGLIVDRVGVTGHPDALLAKLAALAGAPSPLWQASPR